LENDIKKKRLEIGFCEFCKHDGKDKNILTVAHLDQNPLNNDESNIKVLCRSCHIQYDQKYHVFSMSTNKKTDNSFIKEKAELRADSCLLLNKKKIKVLEAYAGSGVIWKEVQKLVPQLEIDILKIEKKGEKKGVYLKGDNEKFISLFDFENFDIIDFDAYGVPFNQLEVLFERKFTGFVHVTFIQTGMGRLPNGLLLKNGFSKEMIKKIPTLFCKNGMEKMNNYLYQNGVTEITGYFNERKNYFYFYYDK
jgi:hypothetical protein